MTERTIPSSTPLPLKLVLLLLASAFFIYIPVSVFRQPAFLLIQDACLLLGILATIAGYPQRAFTARPIVHALIFAYLAAVIISFLLNVPSMDQFTGVRNSLFGVGIFFLSRVWIDSRRAVDHVIIILLLGSLVVAADGIRQLIFGFMPFELDRLAIMGHSVAEMETLGRIRIASTFGDPLTFAFFMMAGVFSYGAARHRRLLPLLSKSLHPLSAILLILALVLTLTRAPLLGLLVGGTLYFFLTFEISSSRVVIYSFLAVLIFATALMLDQFVNSSFGKEFDNFLISALRNGAESFWSLFAFLFSDSGDERRQFLVSQSADQRIEAWSAGAELLLSNPLGLGFSDSSRYPFSLGDVGVLAIGLQSGLMGLGSIVAIFVVIAAHSMREIRQASDDVRKLGYIFLCFWLAIFLTNFVTLIINTSTIAIVVWIVAAILLNMGKIYTEHDFAQA